MTIYVSRSWPALSPIESRAEQHPHVRGSGSYYTFPDEMHAEAQELFRSLQKMPLPVAPGVEVKHEWRRGYPDEQFHLMVGAFCALDDKPEEIVPDFKPYGRDGARERIYVSESAPVGIAA